MEDYNKRLYEVNEILKFLPKDEFTKIPSNIIILIQENMSTNYSWTIDKSKSLQKQNLHRDTIAILSYINLEYLVNQEQKEFFKQVHKQNEMNYLKEQRKIYNPNDIFKQRNSDVYSQKALVEVKETSRLKKLIEKIKKILHII